MVAGGLPVRRAVRRAVLYAVWFYCWIVQLGINDYWELGCIVTAGHRTVLTLLLCYWFVEVNCLLTCTKVPEPTQATLAKVVPQPNNGWTELVPINRTKLPDGSLRIWISFQKVVYTFNTEKREFEALQFKTRRPLDYYFKYKGFESEEAARERAMVYGDNEMEMAILKFIDLFIERFTAPCFALVFGAGRAMLYYSIFTLMKLLFFEVAVWWQQWTYAAEVRNMGNKPYPVYNKIPSNTLFCGDIIAIGRSADQTNVPCDLLLIRGQCIVDESMLTGESESIENVDRRRDFDFTTDGPLHVIYGGTKVVKHTPPGRLNPGLNSPDSGCICYVLRTGFNTRHGQLLRTILFGVKRVTACYLEIFIFSFFLVIFAVAVAVAAGAYVWLKEAEDEGRNRYKLLLQCLLIMARMMPPEWSYGFSFTIHRSRVALRKLGVFCTEPSRIPFAGRVDVCCFDKTGTLTTNNCVVEGIAGLEAERQCGRKEGRRERRSGDHSLGLRTPTQTRSKCSLPASRSPKSTRSWSAIRWRRRACLGSTGVCLENTVIPNKSKLPRMEIYNRWHFSSQLKRMTYTNPPASYDRTYQRLAQAGARVLALGIRELGPLTHQEIRDKKRTEFERSLEFAGFVVISCPLKPDTKSMIGELVDASHIVMMITGDNPLTACHVGSVLHFTKKNSVTLILDEPADSTAEWCWKSVDGRVREELVPANKKETTAFLHGYELCLTGVGYDYLAARHEKFLNAIIAYVPIFARMTPKQKESVIKRLKALGYVPLMCGDGTNDVDALKHANVGVVLLSHPYDATKELIPEKMEARRNSGSSNGHANGSTSSRAATNISNTQARLNQPLLEQEEGRQMIRLGDASIAAPFTSKFTSIQSICHLIKQGRWTLVVTLQMFKILALNALVLAYSQSVLYLDGVKFSDYQAISQSFMLAACVFFICYLDPLKTLSKQRPMPNIFNAYTLLTVTLQFAVHFVCLYVVSEHTMESRQELDLESEFKPNLLNSAIYVMSIGLMVSTMISNFKLLSVRPTYPSLIFGFLLVLIVFALIVPEMITIIVMLHLINSSNLTVAAG
ncbi:hypothetical protein M3Y99_01182000 [Aphelenchoides fujianensis]|nr:hypothetical protein M3Y99_01182000 [Aphelenchoides fujianensis]